MKLMTVLYDHGATAAGRVDNDEIVLLPHPDVGELLASGSDWRERASVGGQRMALDEVAIGRLIPRPPKIFCMSANYLDHVHEFDPNLPPPQFPELFAKFAESLTGPYEDIPLLSGAGQADYQAAIAVSAALPLFAQPLAVDCVDWEAELVVVIGTFVRWANEAEAVAAIAGFTAGNDVSVRDWQLRTSQFLQGKAWEAMSPVGPALVTPDELGGARPDLRMKCVIDEVVMQDGRTGSPVFDPVEVVAYISRFVTLRPGDLIFMGSVPGIGISKNPQVYLRAGQVMTTEIEGIGRMVNRFVAEAGAPSDAREVAAARSGQVFGASDR